MTWTKFSERLPEGAAAFIHWADKTLCVVRPTVSWRDWVAAQEVIPLAWHPITYPELPKEKSQTENDAVACYEAWVRRGIDYMHDSPGSVSEDFSLGWMLALRYERAEVAKLVSRIPCPHASVSSARDQLRKRCGLDK
jgi:hypothetical protein